MYRASWATGRESAPRKQLLCQDGAEDRRSTTSPRGSGVPSSAQAGGSDANSWSRCHRGILSQQGWDGACAPFSQDPEGHGSHLVHTKQSLPRSPSVSPKMEQKLGKGTRFRRLPPQWHESQVRDQEERFRRLKNA